MPPAAARALPDDRRTATASIGAALPPDWPHVNLLDVLPMHASAEPEAEPYGVWVIVERASQRVVGDAGFMGPPGEDGTVEVGYSVIPDRRGRGYATEAVRALVAWVLRQPHVCAVVARCDAGNTASVRLLERIGFHRTGTAGEELHWRLETRPRE